jgi:rare lipoprotein A
VRLLTEKSFAAARHAGGAGPLAAGDRPIKVAALPKADVTSESLAPPPGATMVSSSTPGHESPLAAVERPVIEPASVVESEPVVTVEPVQATNIFVQIGAFARWDNANRVKAMLAGVADVEISSVTINGAELFRTRIGPLATVEDADAMLERVIGNGYPDARIVVD